MGTEAQNYGVQTPSSISNQYSLNNHLILQVSYKIIFNSCTIVFNVPKLHKKTFDMFE